MPPQFWPGATVGSNKSDWESRFSPALVRINELRGEVMAGFRLAMLRIRVESCSLTARSQVSVRLRSAESAYV